MPGQALTSSAEAAMLWAADSRNAVASVRLTMPSYLGLDLFAGKKTEWIFRQAGLQSTAVSSSYVRSGHGRQSLHLLLVEGFHISFDFASTVPLLCEQVAVDIAQSCCATGWMESRGKRKTE